MAELVDLILEEIRKFEVGINEWRTLTSKKELTQKLIAGYDLGFRYAFTLGQLIALLTANNRSGLETVEILATGEGAKVGVHYLFKGVDYMQNLALKYTRRTQSYNQPVTLDLNKP